MRSRLPPLACAAALAALMLGCSSSAQPSGLRIVSVSVDPSTVGPGGTCTLTVTAEPTDGVAYSYRVLAGGGHVTGEGASVTYTAADDAPNNTAATVRCTVTGQAGATASHDARIHVVRGDAPQPSATGLLLVEVTQPDGSPLEGATVTFGASGASTNEQGLAVLRDLAPVTGSLLRVRAEGRWDNVKPVTIIAGEPTSVSVALASIGTSLSSAMGEDVTVMHDGGGAVLPAHSLVDDLGNAAPAVVATATTRLSTDDGYSSIFPGVFTGRRASDGAVLPIRTYGLVHVTVADGLGNPLRLAQGQTAQLTIPMSSVFDPAAVSLPLWRFDEDTDTWAEIGSLPRDPSAPAYTGPVGEIGTWCVGYSYEEALERVSLTNGIGQAIAGALVVAESTGWRSIGYTDESGAATVACPPGETCGIWARRGTVVSSARDAATPAAGQASDTAVSFLAPRAEVILTWGGHPADLAAHLFCAVDPADWGGWVPPDEYEVTRGRAGSLVRAPWAALTADDHQGFGPEIASISRLVPGTYRYVVENASGQSVSPIEYSDAEVTLCLPGGSIRSWSAPLTNPSSASNPYWRVFELAIDDTDGIAVISQNEYSATDAATTL